MPGVGVKGEREISMVQAACGKKGKNARKKPIIHKEGNKNPADFY